MDGQTKVWKGKKKYEKQNLDVKKCIKKKSKELTIYFYKLCVQKLSKKLYFYQKGCKSCQQLTKVCYQMVKLDRVGPVDNIPSPD